MALIQRLLGLLGLLIFCSACGMLDEPILKILMMGIYESPAQANGDRTPQYQKYTITGITGSDADTGEAVNFEDDWEPTSFRIIYRPQQIFAKEISERSGQLIENMTVQFENIIEGGDKSSGVLTRALATTSVVMDGPLKFDRGRSMTLILRVKWRNTILNDEMGVPDLELVLK